VTKRKLLVIVVFMQKRTCPANFTQQWQTPYVLPFPNSVLRKIAGIERLRVRESRLHASEIVKADAEISPAFGNRLRASSLPFSKEKKGGMNAPHTPAYFLSSSRLFLSVSRD
jgi:hypothetical protein